MDVGQQSNGASSPYPLPLIFVVGRIHAVYDLITNLLTKCLEYCKFTHFPVLGERSSSGIKRVQKMELHCSCRLPEKVGDKMAECETCKVWYHQHCMDISSEVFESSDVPWKCK